MTKPFHFDCPFCLERIGVASTANAIEGGKIKCSGCQRKVDVPEDIMSKLSEGDDDDDFLTGVPMKATGDEDILTLADLAVDSGKQSDKKKESSDSGSHGNLLDKDFEFAVVENTSFSETEMDSEQDGDNQKSEPVAESPTESVGEDDPEMDSLLDGFHDQSKSDGEDDLNQLLAGNDGAPSTPVEKGSFGIRCSVCDSRLIVGLSQVGEKVKCSDCFSMIKVRTPTRKEREQIEKQIGLSLDGELKLEDPTPVDDGELTLAPLVEDDLAEGDLVEAEILDAEILEEDEDDDQPLTLREEPEFDEPSEDEIEDDDFADVLLEEEDEDETPELEADQGAADVVFDGEEDFPDDVVDDLDSEDLLAGDLSLSGPLELEDASFVNPAELAAVAKQSKAKEKKKQEGSAEQSEGKDKLNPYRSKSAQQAKVDRKKREQEKAYEPNQKDGKAKSKFPKLRFDAFFGAAVELVTEPSVAVRGFIVAALIAIGNVISHFALANYNAIAAPTMSDTAVMGVWRFGVGWVPYAIGTILLWYFCGVVFREAAAGKTKIKSWQLGPTTEWTSTLLITAVSFAIAGLPVLMLMSIYITAPVRFFLALPFLVAVWYAQSPFAILSADVLLHFRKNQKQWRTVFLVVMAMASIAFVAGVLMHISVPWLNVLTSALGAVFLSFVTLAFSAVAGWHSGMVVEELS